MVNRKIPRRTKTLGHFSFSEELPKSSSSSSHLRCLRRSALATIFPGHGKSAGCARSPFRKSNDLAAKSGPHLRGSASALEPA
jgi:hypothetical protein